MTPTLPEEAVKAAQDAFNKTINDPIMVPCNRCSGKGYHYGFGEDGASPDWCVECGGSAFDVVPGEEERAMRAALTAALPFLPVQGAVKKLEWELVSGDHYAEGASTHYNIYETKPGLWNSVTVKPGNVRLATNVGLEAAKAAAQADYEARTLSALEPSAPDMGNPITLTYTNYRGETSERTITPIRPWFGSTEWHPEPQWLLLAYDHDKSAERDFALKDFGRQEPSAAREMVLYEGDDICARLKGLASWLDSSQHSKWCGRKEVPIHGYSGEGKLVRAAIAAIRALSSPDHNADAGKVEGDGWLPIASAPKDGTEIIYLTKYGSIGFCRYDFAINEDDDDCWWDLQADDEVYPKRWLPRSALPSAPSEGAE